MFPGIQTKTIFFTLFSKQSIHYFLPRTAIYFQMFHEKTKYNIIDIDFKEKPKYRSKIKTKLIFKFEIKSKNILPIQKINNKHMSSKEYVMFNYE